jgi:hypothetical protein
MYGTDWPRIVHDARGQPTERAKATTATLFAAADARTI